MYAIVFFRVVWCGLESTECVPFLCQKSEKKEGERKSDDENECKYQKNSTIIIATNIYNKREFN